MKFHAKVSSMIGEPAQPRLRVPVVVKGYPRLSETFIAQELLELERLGFTIEIWSLRRPTDPALHPMHRAIRAELKYLPEYLYQEPTRLLRALLWSLTKISIAKLIFAFLKDLFRDFTSNRGRRLGQALIFARELSPDVKHVHVHYLHTPTSVVRYACLLTRRTYSFSAHAKDIWTTPDWEKREKIAGSVFGVTCTRQGADELQRLAPAAAPERISLVYHGLDLSRFPSPPVVRPSRDGSDPADPLRICTVGRAVAKKGFDDLLHALSMLPADLHWRLDHIGGGELRNELKRLSDDLKLGDRVGFLGPKPQEAVIALLRSSDLFVLPCKEGDAGDRDGLPNVLLEAATQGLAILSTNFAGVPEFITDGANGRLVQPTDRKGLSDVMQELARDPPQRFRLGALAAEKVRTAYSFEAGVATIATKLRATINQ